MKTILIAYFIVLSSAFPHGDHSIPGALPAPLHEGVIGEAKHEENKDHKGHDHENEKEYFFEVVYKKPSKSIKIYLLELDPENPKVFKKLKPNKSINVVVDLPRSKKKLKIDVKKMTDHWKAELGKFRDRRFYTLISYKDKSELFKSKIMIEKKR